MIEIVLFAVLFSGVVGVLAENKGYRGFHYFCLSLVITPILTLLIVLSKPNKKAQKQQESRDKMLAAQLRMQQAQLEEIRRVSSQSATKPSSPSLTGSHTHKVVVAREGKEIGTFVVSELRDLLSSGHLTLEDDYFDFFCNEWIPLAGHPEFA